MKILVLALFLYSGVSQASAVQLSFSSLVGLGRNLERISLRSIPGGKIELETNLGNETIDPIVLKDQRGTDGSLLLDLGRNRVLEASSGFSPSGLIEYTFHRGSQDIKLSPQVYLEVK